MLYLPILSFMFSFKFTKFLINKFINYKFGYDLHKKEKVKVPEMCGLAPVLSSSLFISLLSPIYSSIILLSSMIGVLDDLTNLSPKEKLFLLFIISTALSLYFYHNFTPDLLIFIFSLPIFSNFTNMLAGFNGLEIGLGVLSSLFLSLIFLLDHNISAFLIALTFSSSYLAFLYFNKYPARAFPGDCGTLPIGAFLSALSIVNNEFLYFVVIMIPYFIDASLKYLSAGVMSRDKHKPTVLGEDGKLYYKGGYLSLPRLILKYKPMSEKSLVLTLWSIEVLFGMLAILIKVTL
ncbi:MraY family glycosyltransferase [Methanocaldococcus infernus]